MPPDRLEGESRCIEDLRDLDRLMQPCKASLSDNMKTSQEKVRHVSGITNAASSANNLAGNVVQLSSAG